jgi:hypothetical protein
MSIGSTLRLLVMLAAIAALALGAPNEWNICC